MGVPQGISLIFFYQIQGFPQFQLPLAMLWKRETIRIWGGKFDRKSTMRYCVPFLKGIVKGQISRLNTSVYQ